MASTTKLVLVLPFLLAVCRLAWADSTRSVQSEEQLHHIQNQYTFQTMFMTQNVDHFGFENQLTFQQRYLVADQFWNYDNGPIFFFTGSEGDIVWLCNNTGFLWDIAPEFKALLVFAEHRYYGQSLPFGTESFANTSVLNYLTVEQGMADYAELIRFLKKTVAGASASPVITVGGHYGGMLAAWMRLKYPNLVLGALASSAPIWQFSSLAPCGTFYETVERTFLTSGSQECINNIADSWSTLTGYWPGNLTFLSKTFSLCKPVEDKYALSDMLDWLAKILGDITMVNYPYPVSFLQPLPAWPVTEFCKFLSEPLSDDQLTVALSKAVKMYFNYTGQAACINMFQQATSNMGEQGWDYQKCTEMVMPVCSNNTRIIFNIDWDLDFYTENCRYLWGVKPRQDWIPLQYWGKDILSASNIIFSNGLLDPWSGGGVLQSLSSSLSAIQIPSGARHLDLRAANAADPADVIAARQQEKNIMKIWLYGEEH